MEKIEVKIVFVTLSQLQSKKVTLTVTKEIISGGRNYCNLNVTIVKQYRIVLNRLKISCFLHLGASYSVTT